MKGPVCPGSDGEMQLAVQGQQRPQEGGLGPWGCFSTLERGTAPGPQEAPSGGGRALSEDSPLLAPRSGNGQVLDEAPQDLATLAPQGSPGKAAPTPCGESGVGRGPPGAGFHLPSPDPSDLGEAPVHLYAS